MLGFGIGELFTLVAALKTGCDIIDEGPAGPLAKMALTSALPFGAALDAVEIAHDVFGVGRSSSSSTTSEHDAETPNLYPSTTASRVSYSSVPTVRFASAPRVRF